MRKLLIVPVLLLAASLALPVFAQVDPTATPQGDMLPTTTTDATPVAPTTVPQATTIAPTTVPSTTTLDDGTTVPQTNIQAPTTANFITNNYVYMGEALQASGLGDPWAGGQFTVFVPNDGAFQTLLNNLEISLNDLMSNQALLQGVINYHVVPGIYTAEDILNGQLGALETAHGSALTFGFDNLTSRVTINNGAASIESTDIRTGNGIVHIIDNVLLPPNVDDLMRNPVMASASPEARENPSIATISENTFVVLTEAVAAAGLADELASGEYTLFAPNDGAFLTFLADQDMSYAQLLADQTLLQDVLSYHLVPGTVTVEDIQAGQSSLQTVNGANLNFGFNPGTSRVIINGGAASVEHPDIVASNGIVHIIDNVLLPPR
ncbi:MAG TPA: fasciclin domain-containing protein [Spirillospora sp.]|nr:fasciclin domain-containing protein [Spirillospora sp.]